MSLEVYIGPNGYGKTTKLNNLKDSLVNVDGISESEILFLDSEILLLDEMKDTKDNTKTMEYIISEIISTPAVITAQNAYEVAIDSAIAANIPNVNLIVDDILALAGNNRNVIPARGPAINKDFLEVTPKKEYKKIVKINSKDLIEGKMGSGQRMQLILSLVKNSSKSYIFIDEPEKYSHPSLLHRTAKIIYDLSLTKHVYIATHSAKLLSMINLNLSSLYIINDDTHLPRQIDFAGICSSYSTHSAILSTYPDCTKSFSYFNSTGLQNNIKALHYKEFLESLFSRDVYLVEGVNDFLFINKMLRDNNLYYEDYTVFPCFGKHHMMLFAKIFESLNIKVHIYFDEDNIVLPYHASSNAILNGFSHKYMFLPKLEPAIGFLGSKYNQVELINYLDSYTITATFLC